MHPLVERIEGLFLPVLEQLAIEMRQQYPEFSFAVWSSPTGNLTEHQGHDLGIECSFMRDIKKNSENVALLVELCFLTSTPRVMSEVVWGYPSGHLEASFREYRSSNEWPIASQDVLSDLVAGFPEMIAVLRGAVARGAFE